MQAESLRSYRFEIPSPVLKESQPAAETIVPFLASTWISVMSPSLVWKYQTTRSIFRARSRVLRLLSCHPELDSKRLSLLELWLSFPGPGLRQRSRSSGQSHLLQTRTRNAFMKNGGLPIRLHLRIRQESESGVHSSNLGREKPQRLAFITRSNELEILGWMTE
jgi:hypothetical protein